MWCGEKSPKVLDCVNMSSLFLISKSILHPNKVTKTPTQSTHPNQPPCGAGKTYEAIEGNEKAISQNKALRKQFEKQALSRYRNIALYRMRVWIIFPLPIFFTTFLWFVGAVADRCFDWWTIEWTARIEDRGRLVLECKLQDVRMEVERSTFGHTYCDARVQVCAAMLSERFVKSTYLYLKIYCTSFIQSMIATEIIIHVMRREIPYLSPDCVNMKNSHRVCFWSRDPSFTSTRWQRHQPRAHILT